MKTIRVQILLIFALIVSVLISALIFNTVPRESDFYYRGDFVTHVFHKPGCWYYGGKTGKVLFKEKQDAINAGYLSCNLCNP